jgi:hypothetical protein
MLGSARGLPGSAGARQWRVAGAPPAPFLYQLGLQGWCTICRHPSLHVVILHRSSSVLSMFWHRHRRRRPVQTSHTTAPEQLPRPHEQRLDGQPAARYTPIAATAAAAAAASAACSVGASIGGNATSAAAAGGASPAAKAPMVLCLGSSHLSTSVRRLDCSALQVGTRLQQVWLALATAECAAC